MERTCPICRGKYDDGGDHWKKMCYKCYKEYRFLHGIGEKSGPIKKYGYKADVYLSHPDVTKEEMDKWIADKGLEHGWGVEEWKPENWSKYKIWVNSTNYD